MKEYSFIRKSLPRIDGIPKAKGDAAYTGDIKLPHMLAGKILRSPLPHGKILNVDVSKAERLPGVKAVITGKDCPSTKFSTFPLFLKGHDEHILAIDKVRYIGDEVAAVAAIDEDIAEEALGLIQMEYEELPSVFDPIEAMREDAPRVHESRERNISARIFREYGDVEAGFNESSIIREDRFETQSVTHCPLEPHTVLASSEDGRVTVWSSTQVPFYVSRTLAMTLGMPEGRIRVIKPHMGGGFGGKSEAIAHELCAPLLSQRAEMPVKISYTREEVFCCTRRRHPMIIDLKIGVKRDGTFAASQCRIIADGGAYTGYGAIPLYLASILFSMPYMVPGLKYEGFRVHTNKCVSGAQRGFGGLQPRFAFEIQLDMIAQELRMDPAEIRLKNTVKRGDLTASKLKIISTGIDECIQKVVQWFPPGPKAPSMGRGMGCYSFVSGASIHRLEPSIPHTTASITMSKDSNAILYIGSSDIGQGSDTILTQITAEELGISPENIKVVSADTELTMADMGSYSSRVTLMAGEATRRAAAELKKVLFQASAEILEANPEDLDTKDGRIYVKGSPEKSIAYKEVVEAAFLKKGMPITGMGSYAPPPNTEGSPSFSFGANGVQLILNPETGKIEDLQIFAAHDCGFAINPMSVEGQLEGSISMGLGQALGEEMIFHRGLLLNPSFLDYKVPSSMDIDKIEAHIVESIDPEGPFGAKEAGEGTILTACPAVANALHDVLGIHIKTLPLTPEKILEE